MTELLRRRWLALVVGAWAILLLVLAFLGRDATVAEQRDIGQARVAVDAAAVDLVRAAGRDAAVRVSPYQKARDCRISLVRDGADYRRWVDLVAAPGKQAALLDALARRLPEAYRTGVTGDRLSAVADGFVTLHGRVRDGVLRVELRTGCRPLGDPVATWHAVPTRSERARAVDALRAVGSSEDEARWRTGSIRCGDGVLRTVDVTTSTPADRPLAESAWLVPPDARVLVREPRLLAYRQGARSVVVDAGGGRLRVTTADADC